MKQLALLPTLATAAGMAMAHPGHGADVVAGHWHASDLWGLAGALAVAAAAWWWGRSR